tara:strand:+ start:1097 stop:1537 length:441 start_codon:yes stop_codon:yes gene_type:complete
METKELFTYWNEIVDYFEIPKNLSQIIFEHILQCHLAEGRHYHTITHVGSLLSLIDHHELKPNQRITLLIAAFFHDIIYNTDSSENEIESAELMERYFDLLEIESSEILKASEIIKATQFHKSDDNLTQLFLDMDLSILGTSEAKY